MADKYKANDKVLVPFVTGDGGSTTRMVQAVVLYKEGDRYRCQTSMGVAILYTEDEMQND